MVSIFFLFSKKQPFTLEIEGQVNGFIFKVITNDYTLYLNLIASSTTLILLSSKPDMTSAIEILSIPELKSCNPKRINLLSVGEYTYINSFKMSKSIN